MNYKQIKLSTDEKYFEFQGQLLWNKTFKNAMKFHEPGYAPVEDENGWFHIDTNGNDLYSERYSKAFGFYFNRAAVVQNQNWFHINEKGERIYSENYTWCGNYQEDICTVRNFDNNYFHIDLQGQRIYSENYKYAGDFKDRIACVMLKNRHFTHIKNDGKLLHSKYFNDLGVYHKGFATAKDEKGWFHIDKQGNEVYKKRYLMAEPFYNGLAFCENFEKQKVVISEVGYIMLKI